MRDSVFRSLNLPVFSRPQKGYIPELFLGKWLHQLWWHCPQVRLNMLRWNICKNYILKSTASALTLCCIPTERILRWSSQCWKEAWWYSLNILLPWESVRMVMSSCCGWAYSHLQFCKIPPTLHHCLTRWDSWCGLPCGKSFLHWIRWG